MKHPEFLRWLLLALVFTLVCPVAAQNYYPATIGNTWILESDTGEDRRTYTLEGPETVEGKELTILKIETVGPDIEIPDIDRYFVSVGDEVIGLHKTVLDEGTLGTVTAVFEPAATFFRLRLAVGDKWEIPAELKLEVRGIEIALKNITDVEVVALETVETPAGTFENCAKVKLRQRVTSVFLNLDSTSYQWLAPDVGPVKYLNINSDGSDGSEYHLVNFKLGSPYDVNGDGTVNILDLVLVSSRFGQADADADVNGDGVVNILDLTLIAGNFGN